MFRLGIIHQLLIVIILVTAVVSGGCSKGKPEINACTLLDKSELLSLSVDIKGHDYFPKSGNKPQVCVWHDGANTNLVMIFYYDSTQVEPVKLVKNGMGGKDSNIVEISGVGSAAAAAFAESSTETGSGEMRLFAAKNDKGVIGIKAKDVGGQSSEGFETVKNLANRALSRLP